MPRPRWPDSTNPVSDEPGTLQDLGPEILEWAVWQASRGDGIGLLRYLTAFDTSKWESTGRINFGAVLAGLLHSLNATGLEVSAQVFSAQALRGVTITQIAFTECEFWQLDLGRSRLLQCRFERCSFGHVLFDDETDLSDSTFQDWDIHSLETRGTAFFGSEIAKVLVRLGAHVVSDDAEDGVLTEIPVAPQLTKVLERAVRLSEQTCDVALEDLEEDFGTDARTVHRAALESEIIKPVTKSVRGTRRTFFRFRVDRNQLLNGRAGNTGIVGIDAFWRRLAQIA